jgi:hypothetical protein
MLFCEWLRHQHAADELFLHNILWTDEACFTREGVFNIHNSDFWARDNPHAIRERGYQVRFSVIVWAGTVGDIVMGPYLLPDRLTAQRYRNFLETSTGLLEDVPLAVRQRLWFQHDGAPALPLWGRCPAVVERDISRNVELTWRADCMVSSVAESNSDGFFL